jgi:hypothetical protein
VARDGDIAGHARTERGGADRGDVPAGPLAAGVVTVMVTSMLCRRLSGRLSGCPVTMHSRVRPW